MSSSLLLLSISLNTCSLTASRMLSAAPPGPASLNAALPLLSQRDECSRRRASSTSASSRAVCPHSVAVGALAAMEEVSSARTPSTLDRHV